MKKCNPQMIHNSEIYKADKQMSSIITKSLLLSIWSNFIALLFTTRSELRSNERGYVVPFVSVYFSLVCITDVPDVNGLLHSDI